MEEVFTAMGSDTAATMWIVSASLFAVFLDALGKTSEVKNSKVSQNVLEKIDIIGKLVAGIVALTFLAGILVPEYWLWFPIGALIVFAVLAVLLFRISKRGTGSTPSTGN
ncbi:hypothetical protein SLW73_02465 [Glutamicibacter protophormiae]|uniref:hypothetical protein n=1 Tax=Glutamicibacter protophormiae TaxID=37930 RepID=UPI002A833CAA|nr:hypothetical protein [Glutamicibacter protophormiae]WPR65223.1 hypothetical protein SLW72_02465 [Glutamicibacter protophormiae]WPR68720.1 hypothetical protein SLW73_02465 [Glutamicibacter protophormiae]